MWARTVTSVHLKVVAKKNQVSAGNCYGQVHFTPQSVTAAPPPFAKHPLGLGRVPGVGPSHPFTFKKRTKKGTV
jgi:hypothetical protein